MRVQAVNRWSALAWGEISLFLLPLGYWLFQTPFPLGDGLRTFDYAARYGWSDVWTNLFSGTAEFRPLYFSAVKLIHDAAGGPSVAAFRAVQLGFIALDLALFHELLRPRTASRWFGFTLGAATFVGLHTVTDNLTASTPLPFGPMVFALLLGTLLLLRRRPGPSIDVAAGLFSLTGIFLIEYGVTVGVVWIVAGLARMGAARRSTALAAAAALGAYATLRLLTNPQAVPGPFYTDTGYLFRMIPVDEQVALFGADPWRFRLYNVVATLGTVLLSEPRNGIYHGLDALLNDAPVMAWQVVHWFSSVLATVLLGAWVARWRRLPPDSRCLIVLGVVVILTNSALGYMYTRDRIPTAAGMFYAVLVGFAAASAWEHRPRLTSGTDRRALTILLCILATAWVARAVGTILVARDQAWLARAEWTEQSRRARGVDPDWDEITARVGLELQRDALERPLRDPRTDPEWLFVWFDRKQF